MPPSAHTRARKLGLPPGTLIHTGERRAETVTVSFMRYDEFSLQEGKAALPEDIPAPPENGALWIDVDGLHNVELIERLGKRFGLHPLLLEDVLNTRQRPKVEEYDDCLYVVCRMLRYEEAPHAVREEQYSLVIGRNYVLSFQEGPGDVLDPVRERLRSGRGRLRRSGADFLGYTLLDAVVDNYFVVLDKFGEEMTKLERELVAKPHPKIHRALHHLKRELAALRLCVGPLREAVAAIIRQETAIIGPQNRVYLRDLYDHVTRMIETIESNRDLLSGMMEVYLSGMSHRMNAVMQMLTVISTIFMPLMLVTGIYGMNFEHMPELGWRFGYPFALGLMVFITLGMLAYVRRRNWLG